jgi:hypothetical protein
MRSVSGAFQVTVTVTVTVTIIVTSLDGLM